MIRLATEDDTPDIERMARLFCQHSPYKDQPIDDLKISALCRDILEADKTQKIVILSCQPKPVGLIVGMTSEFLFNHRLMATELMWWMDPEYRSSRDSLRLLEAYEYWAKNIAKAELVQMSLLSTNQETKIDNLYRRRGYELTEKSFLKELN